ncbi:hypothetical protein PIB30_095275, partial [Stylosanthes scabra]|nr:hypothetical protein [Stylosanthes scabra]
TEVVGYSVSCPRVVPAVGVSCSRRSTIRSPWPSTSPVRVLCKLTSTVASPVFCCPSLRSVRLFSLQLRR